MAGGLAALLIFLAPACSVPLAPGYSVVEQRREVEFTSGEAPKIHIRAEYLIQNTGTTPLSYVDVKLPAEKAYGRSDSRAEIGGREAGIEQLPEEYREDSPDVWRIPLGSPLRQKNKLRLAIDYDLSAPGDQGGRITIGANDFHLGARGWSPELEPPRHLLSPRPKRPKETAYTVRVPAGYQVSARGGLKNKKENKGEWVYTFALGKNDLAPFVVAGRYQQTPPGAGEDETRFWTQSPLAGDVPAAQKELEQAWNTMKSEFGPSASGAAAPLIVEAKELQEENHGEIRGASGFPGGALVNPELLAKGADSPVFLDEVSIALAHDWFGDEIYPPAFAAISMGEGLPEYATIVMAEAREGEAGRKERVEKYLAAYDAASRTAGETPLGLARESDSVEVKQIARAKAPLFYAALEDAYGEKPVRAGLRQMVTLMRGQEAGIDVMRSALEQSTGKNLAAVFREWLYGKGIPADFRARYETEAGPPR